MSDFAEIKKRRDEIKTKWAKWEASGFLDGLTGMANEKIVEKFQCCTNSKINYMLEINEIKKDLYKSKVMANFSHYVSGNLYYEVQIMGSKYLFPISTYSYPNLSEDLGTTAFNAEIKASELIRWIGKALEKGELIKVG
jgi:hypothetical protein